MMVARIPAFLSALIVASAASVSGAVLVSRGSCNVGTAHCCNTVHKADSETSNILASLLDLALGSLNTGIGLNCSPLNVGGLGGGSCDASPVCCDNDNWGGLINIGCMPLILG